MVRILCNDGREVTVNIHAASAASPTLKGVLEAPREEGAVVWIEAPSNGFEIFADWMSSGKIKYTTDKLSTSVISEIRLLCEAYHTGHILDAPMRLLDNVMDCIIDSVTCQTDRGYEDLKDIITTLLRAFIGEPTGRTFIVDWLVEGNFTRCTPPDDMAREFIKVIHRDTGLWSKVSQGIICNKFLSSVDCPWDTDRCRYHQHGHSAHCYQKQESRKRKRASSKDSDSS